MSRVYKLVVLVLLVLLVALGACGGGSSDEPSQSAATDEAKGGGGRTVQVEMVEHAFKAADLGTVKKGETITFKFTNTGTVDHEAFIGDAAAQLAYAEQVDATAKSHAGAKPHGDDGHDDHPKGSIHLKPGATGELTYTFSEAEEVEIACYEADHYEAGMRLTVQPQ